MDQLKYEISSGTYIDDLADFHWIEFINTKKAANLPVYMRHITVNFSQKFYEIIPKLIDPINEYLNGKSNLIPYMCGIKSLFCKESTNNEVYIVFHHEYDSSMVRISICGSDWLVKEIEACIKVIMINNIYETSLYPHIEWFYSMQGKIQSSNIELKDNQIKVSDDHYPFIEKGVDAYLDEFMNNTASILLLAGEPGTGKTSFIRHISTKYNKSMYATYDEYVMNNDYFYVKFLENKKIELMVIEDADVLLLERTRSENKVLAKFLNVSDGLIKNNNKKIIFSTNITQLNTIDPALIRKGRCFDVLEFRKLSYHESQRFVNTHKIDIDLIPDKEYSLAELLNNHSMAGPHAKTGNKLGF